MLDNLKLITYDQNLIVRLTQLQGFERYQHRNNNFDGFCKYGKLMRLDFRKSFEKKILVGYHHLEISISPHYHFNNYLHNGNYFTPENCINTISEILNYLGIEPQEYDRLKVVNIEFGLNIIPEIDIKNLINGLYFYKKTTFIIPEPKNKYFKITDATNYKKIKAYAKGLQFTDFPEYAIDINSFRFEVKSKQAKKIVKYGITTVCDLLNLNSYNQLGQSLLEEWEQILLISPAPDFNNLKAAEVQLVKRVDKIDFWSGIDRVKFARLKEKYYQILGTKNNVHRLIKLQIIDKLSSFQNVTYSTQKTLINNEKMENVKTAYQQINLENVTTSQNIKVCLVTGLDISMQRKGSKFLCYSGLKYYKENNKEVYRKIQEKYLTQKKRKNNVQNQLYYIAHNIRNTFTNIAHNPKHSRKRFEKRNYNNNQLQINF